MKFSVDFLKSYFIPAQESYLYLFSNHPSCVLGPVLGTVHMISALHMEIWAEILGLPLFDA